MRLPPRTPLLLQEVIGSRSRKRHGARPSTSKGIMLPVDSERMNQTRRWRNVRGRADLAHRDALSRPAKRDSRRIVSATARSRFSRLNRVRQASEQNRLSARPRNGSLHCLQHP